MNLFSSIASLFTRAPADTTSVLAEAVLISNFAGVVLGQALAVAEIISLFDPPLGAQAQADIALLTTLNSDLGVALKAAESGASLISNLVTELTTQAVNVSVLIAPFYKVVANEVGTVSAESIAVVKAVSALL